MKTAMKEAVQESTDQAMQEVMQGDTQDARDLIQRDLAVLWHPCSQMQDYQILPPLPIASAEGSWLTLTDGRKVFDAISSWWCKSLGHRHPRLLAALQEQAARFEHVIQAGTTNAQVVELCERLLAIGNGRPQSDWGAAVPPAPQPGRYGKVFLADNGSTGVEVAMKLAVHAQAHAGRGQRHRFASLAGGYHGETLATLSVGDLGLYGEPYKDLLLPVSKLGPLPTRSGPEDPAWDDCSREWLRIEAQLQAAAPELAAIIYEPILQGAGGMRLYSPDLLRRLRNWADRQQVFLIADEIASGFGRCGRMLAQEWAGPAAAADFCVLSKGFTGGALPLSAVLIPDAIFQMFYADYFSYKAFMHSNTHTGNALAVAVANAAIRTYADEDIARRVEHCGGRLRQRMQQLAVRYGQEGSYRGVGMLAAFDLPPGEPRQRRGWQVYREALSRGVLLRNLGDTIYVFPPLTTSEAELAEIFAHIDAALAAVVKVAA